MQRPTAFNAAEVLLAGHHAPGLVANVDENVISTVEGAERNTLAGFGELLESG